MHAYLDPGSGSMLLGLLASGLAGIVVVVRTFGHRIKSALFFWKKDDAAVAAPAETPAAPEADQPSASAS